MADGSSYEYDTTKGYAVVAFNSSLSDYRWGDIEKVGSEIKERLVAMDRPIFLLDLTRLDFMGSSIVALIVKLWKATQEKDGDMVIVNSSSMIGEVLEIAGLTRVWKIVDSREEAEEMLGVNHFTTASPMAKFFLAILGWVSAAGALFFVVAPRKQLLQLDVQTAQILACTCGSVAIIAGLVAIVRDQGVWRWLGILLVIVAAGVTVAEALGRVPSL
ncbi:MAG: STAS domain-containing protein [Rhodopirellula sp.]|nr:STAS domain-containing protein [Rhodopirellula sp.]